MSDGYSLFERFRRYLTILADASLDQRLRVRVSPSDVVQETLFEAYRDREQFRGTTEAERVAWLRQILARNLANAVRDNRRQKRDYELERSLELRLEHSSRMLGAILHGDDTSPSEHAIRSEEILLLANAMAALPDDERQVLVLYHWHGMSLNDIGGQTGKSRFAVARALRRGLAGLRSRLASLEEE